MRLDQLSQATITRIAEEIRARLPAARSCTADAESASLNYDPIEKNTVMEIRLPFVLNVLVTGEGCARRRSNNIQSDTSESSSVPSSLDQSLSSASESEGPPSISSSSPRTAVDMKSPMKLNN